MNRKKDNLVQKLKGVAEYWFSEGLKNGMAPHVMGCLPNPVESERQKCLCGGIPEEVVNSTINTAWQKARQKH